MSKFLFFNLVIKEITEYLWVCGLVCCCWDSYLWCIGEIKTKHFKLEKLCLNFTSATYYLYNLCITFFLHVKWEYEKNS